MSESMNESITVRCIADCLGAWDNRWPGEVRRIKEGEVFDTDFETKELPSFLVIVDGSIPEPDEEIQEELEHLTFSDAAGHDFRILQALNKLDPDNDSHWTDSGLPSVRAVNSFIATGDSITRAQVHNCSPDFFRPA